MFSRRTVSVAIAVVVCAGGFCMTQDAPSTQPGLPYTAEITGSAVQVRSGSSTNHYPVAILNKGARVTVVAVEHEWLGIVPPEGCFSLIKDTYLDRGRDPSIGIVNGDRVNVRVGSTMSSQKYAVQLQLSKGTRVLLTGESDEGFLRIVPPEGAKVWISSQYARPVTGAAPVPQTQVAVAPAPAAPQTRPAVAEPSAGAPIVKAPASQPVVVTRRVEPPSMPPAEWEARSKELRSRLETLEARYRHELGKPMFTRDLSPLLERYRSLADQKVDEYTRYFAQSRITQIEELAASIDSVRKAYDLRGTVDDERGRFASERDKLKTVHIRTEEKFAARGELRESAIYTSPVGPRRLRLIDPSLDTTRTVCYVEIPRDSSIDVNQYLGRVVGVRAKTKRLKTDSIDPVPILVAEELVLLERVGQAPPATVPAATGPSTRPGDES